MPVASSGSGARGRTDPVCVCDINIGSAAAAGVSDIAVGSEPSDILRGWYSRKKNFCEGFPPVRSGRGLVINKVRKEGSRGQRKGLGKDVSLTQDADPGGATALDSLSQLTALPF